MRLVRPEWVGGDSFSAIHAESLTLDVYIVSFFFLTCILPCDGVMCPVCMRKGNNVGSDVGGASHSIIIVAALLLQDRV